MKKIIITTIIFFFLILITASCQAAGSVSLSANKTKVNPGDEFTISANLSGASIAALTLRVTVDTSKVDYVSGPSNTSFSGGRVIYTWVDPNGGSTPKTSRNNCNFYL